MPFSKHPPQRQRAIFDDGAVDRAEAKLRALSVEFEEWMAEEVEKVHAARNEARADAWTDAAFERLFAASHDAKGLGATYEYPLITELAASLCRLLETDENKAAARSRLPLIDAHVDAMRAAARDKIKTPDHPVGKVLLRELTRQVDGLGLAVMF